MIQNIWECGYIASEKGVEPIIAIYVVEILLDNGDRVSFRNSEPDLAKITALEYILKLYSNVNR